MQATTGLPCEHRPLIDQPSLDHLPESSCGFLFGAHFSSPTLLGVCTRAGYGSGAPSGTTFLPSNAVSLARRTQPGFAAARGRIAQENRFGLTGP